MHRAATAVGRGVHPQGERAERGNEQVPCSLRSASSYACKVGGFGAPHYPQVGGEVTLATSAVGTKLTKSRWAADVRFRG
jgi:hypothetical protein